MIDLLQDVSLGTAPAADVHGTYARCKDSQVSKLANVLIGPRMKCGYGQNSPSPRFVDVVIVSRQSGLGLFHLLTLS